MGAQRYSALDAIAGRLLALAPPRISALLERLAPDDAQEFRRIVREFLPEHEREILSEEGAGQQIAAFADRFRDRYFPLHSTFEEGLAESYEELIGSIPVMLQAIDYDDYHELPEFRNGLQLMAFVVADPYQEGSGGGGRVPLGESCRKFVSLEALMQVPDQGMSPEALGAALAGSPYAALVTFADILFQRTRNFFLDTDEETFRYHYSEIEWTKEVVEELTPQWKQAKLAWQQVTRMAEAVEKAPEDWLDGLLGYLRQKGALHGNGAVGQAEGAPVGAAGGAAGPAGPPPGQARLF